jgi:branched-chain amino acid transport system ATP-binding protein
LNNTSKMLNVTNLSKNFDRLRAVNGVSLTVPQGQIVGLIGPNGSGKSTLLNVIAGNLPPDGGAVIFAARDITGLSPDAIFRLGLARSFQEPSLFFRMTVLDNALLPVKGQRGERPGQAPFHGRWIGQEIEQTSIAARVLDQVQLQGHYDRLASDLSGGQMKLLELGRSLMGAPQLFLLDEPTAGVAPAIFEEIDRLRREHGLTFLIVEHRLEILFDFVDLVYVMHLGEVIAHGPPDEIAANDQVREIYFGE